MSKAARIGARNKRDDRMHPVIWFLLTVWTTMRGALGLILTIGIFGGVVTLIVLAVLDTGPEEVLVPNVVGMPLGEAREQAEAVGLELAVVRERYSTTVGNGKISATRPAGGNTTKAGRRIEAVLSLGAREVKVPTVVGHSLKSATKLIEDAGLRVGDVSREANEADAEVVLKQVPSAGEVVGRENEVRLVISGGAEYGQIDLAGGGKLYFRTAVIRVPSGQSLQRVIVRVRGRDGEVRRTFYNRVRRPGDEVRADIYAATGETLEINVARETVLEKAF